MLADRIALKRSQNNEEQLYKQLTKFFNRLKKEVLKALEEYWSDYQLFQGQVNLICSPVHEAHREYYEILEKYKKREYRLGVKEAERQVKNENRKHKIALKAVQTFPISSFIKKDKDALFGTLPSAERDMLNKTFTASERTLSRVDSQINQIITDGYRQGYGINQIANDLTRRFDQLSTWESKRIARTEIHGSHNTAVMDTYRDMDVEYIQWDAAGDDRTRDSHVEIDGEIIPIGSTFSNGLQFPGDTSGPIEEWINCRCSNAPFVIPYGYMAPSFSPFREEDLIPVETKPIEPTVEQPVIEEPTSMVQGKYETFTEYDKRSKAEDTVYRFESGLEVAVNAKAHLTFEEVKSHIDQLPQPLRNIDTLNRINICGHHDATAGGRFYPRENKVEVYLSAGNKVKHFDTLNHELAHALDWKMGGKEITTYGYSKTEIYEKIFKEDNKLHTVVNERTGRKRTPKIFVTDYAARNFTKYKKRFKEHMKVWEKSSKTTPKPNDFRFGEDFAESTKRYLNPSDHAEFVEKFPNRAEYLESIYGKLTFDKNSPHSKAIEYENKAYLERENKRKEQERQNEAFENLSKKELDAIIENIGGKNGVELYYEVKSEYDRLVAVRRTLFTGEPQFMIDVGYTPSEAIEYANNVNKYLKPVKKEYEKYKEDMDKLNKLIKQRL